MTDYDKNKNFSKRNLSSKKFTKMERLIGVDSFTHIRLSSHFSKPISNPLS